MNFRQLRRAFSLIELLVVIVGLGLAIGFGVVMLSSLLKIDRSASASVHRQIRHFELTELFRDDVAHSLAAPENFGDLKSSPHCLILQQLGDRWIIYRWTGRVLERITRQGDKEHRRPITLGSAEHSVEFDRGTAKRPLIRMTITETMTNGLPRRMDISAALQGDLK